RRSRDTSSTGCCDDPVGGGDHVSRLNATRTKLPDPYQPADPLIRADQSECVIADFVQAADHTLHPPTRKTWPPRGNATTCAFEPPSYRYQSKGLWPGDAIHWARRPMTSRRSRGG